jgi:hypothetical protein
LSTAPDQASRGVTVARLDPSDDAMVAAVIGLGHDRRRQ